jgi:hypothetical protein
MFRSWQPQLMSQSKSCQTLTTIVMRPPPLGLLPATLEVIWHLGDPACLLMDHSNNFVCYPLSRCPTPSCHSLDVLFIVLLRNAACMSTLEYFSNVFHARPISMFMSLNGIEDMYSNNRLDCISVLWDVMYLEYMYTCIPRRFRRLVCKCGRDMMLIDLLRCNAWEYTYSCIPQMFRTLVCVYSRNVMSNSFLWYNVGSAHIFVFHKGLKDLYACKAVILY